MSRHLLLDETRQYSFQPAFQPPDVTVKLMQNGQQPADCCTATAQDVPGRQHQACRRCAPPVRQDISVLTLSAHDAIWPLLAATRQLDDPAMAAQKSAQPSNGRRADGHQQPPKTINLAQELVQVAGPAAAQEPHIVLVWGR